MKPSEVLKDAPNDSPSLIDRIYFLSLLIFRGIKLHESNDTIKFYSICDTHTFSFPLFFCQFNRVEEQLDVATCWTNTGSVTDRAPPRVSSVYFILATRRGRNKHISQKKFSLLSSIFLYSDSVRDVCGDVRKRKMDCIIFKTHTEYILKPAEVFLAL